MKKIFTIIAAIMCAASLYAQGEAGTIEVSKTVKDNENGTYTVTLEAFTTGSMVQTIVTQPCNIVLLLDNTSSMYKQDMNGKKRITALREGVTAFLDAIQSSAVDGEVEHNLAFVEFRCGMLRSKLDVTTSLWTNSEYSFKNGSETINALYSLSEWGLGLDDWVTFGTGHESTYNAIRTEIALKAGVDYSKDDNKRKGDASRFNYYWQSGYTDSYTGTPAGSALRKAGDLIDAMPAEFTANDQPTIVVFFTDGQCGYADSWGVASSYTGNNRIVAEEVIHQSNLLKAKDVTIYSIGVFSGLSGTQLTDTYFYLNHVSSKYNSEVTQTLLSTYSGTTDKQRKNEQFTSIDPGDKNAPDNEMVFLATSSEDLEAAFDKIAQDVEDISEPYDLGINSAVVLDVMTNVFKLPAGATTDDVSLYTCSTETNNPLNNDPIWKTDATGKEIWTPFTGTVSFGKDSEGADEVLVSGFDYSSYYVGKNYDGETPTSWRSEGKKLIIQFNIVPSQGNPGGLDVQTNKATSGVYRTDEDGNPTGDPVATFNVPAVQLPYLEIVMKGLAPGESAAFLVTRRNADGTLDTSDTAYSAKVLITCTGNEAEGEFPHAFLKLLTSGNYLVEQIGWSWAYTPYYLNPGTSVEVQGSSLTQTMHTVVPGSKPDEFLVYTFINHTNTGTADHAEDYQPNNMGDGVVPDPGTQGGGNDNPETDPFA